MASPGPKEAALASTLNKSSLSTAIPEPLINDASRPQSTAPPALARADSVKLEDSPAPSRPESAEAETPQADDDSRKGISTAGRKRKLNSISARGVANLTPDQLAKKRANDRQAQRAIRERTKTHIDALEQQVRDLSSQKPILDLQAAVKRYEAIQEENKELRQRLQAVMDIIQPLGKREPTSNGPTAAPNAQTQLVPPPSNPSPPLDNNRSTPNSQKSATADQSYPESLASLGTPSPTHSAPTLGGARMSSVDGSASFRVALDYQRHNLTHGLDFSTDERLGFNFLLEPSKTVSKVDNLRQATQVDQLPIYTPPVNPAVTDRPPPAYLTLVRNSAPTCTLDAVLLDFLHTRQHEAAQGVPKQNLVGPPYPSVSSLLNPEKSMYSHPVSKVFTDILRTFPNIASLPEQVAVLYLMFLLMRWQIYPTAENYDRMPDWLTPRPSQLLTPHPPWIDYLPWPRMRDRLVMRHQGYVFENWFVPFTETLSVNWPYEATDCLLSTNECDELLVNPVFERHFRNLENWSLGPAFAEAYPEMVEMTKIKVPWQTP
ncbi:bZIP transcription factor [Aspergillus glaucus CBS 516.65]|uniref:BZIP domain-containing protein n=1 Tax=Aspergillus glaucus CBS 516.65 TaxID=1160497 RepID=A0A1L9VAP0_ASPGL|nr:hypothetical protein ASPGLDRAFT_38507 [Aspergillus glaucus CBS 516.65]OJJ80892.1 hypothetical protein ASPGLDRAFT_38507 [Aspergillus glaucus CBS 516.65]